MLDILKIRIAQGFQAIPDITRASVAGKFRGLPVLNAANFLDSADLGRICPTKALMSGPLRLDLGKCVFCGECARKLPEGTVRFTNFHKLAASSREHLIVDEGTTAESYEQQAVKASETIKRLFGRSLKLRSVSAGGCNGCELELNACSNVNFDMGRFGIDIVASPRHADGIIITGPVTENMAKALEATWQAVPEPKLLIAAGSCAVSGGLFAGSPAIERKFFKEHPVNLYVPGCPPHPLTLIDGLLKLLR